jgi:hypothetical protein
MTSSSLLFAFASRRRALVRASLPAAMHCGWGAGIGIGSVDDLIL